MLNCHPGLEPERLKLYPDPDFVIHALSFFVLLFKILKNNKKFRGKSRKNPKTADSPHCNTISHLAFSLSLMAEQTIPPRT